MNVSAGPPPIQAPPPSNRRNLWLAAALFVLTPCAFGAFVIRGCMNGHSRSVGHGDIVFDPSPDGRSIAYAAEGNGGRDLYLFHLEGGRIERLTNTPDYEVGPAFSPDGSMIAFTVGAPGVRADQLAVMTLSDRRVRLLTQVDENHSGATFSGDGKRVLFTRETEYRWGGLASNWDEGGELWSVDLNGKDHRRELPGVARLWQPQLSGDGKWIAWYDDSGASFATMDGGSAPNRFDPMGREPTLSPEGEWIAYSSGEYSPDHKIYLLPRRGGKPTLMAKEDGGCFQPRFSPDSKEVYYLLEEWLNGPTGGPTVSLWKVGVDGTGKALVMDRECFKSPATR